MAHSTVLAVRVARTLIWLTASALLGAGVCSWIVGRVNPFTARFFGRGTTCYYVTIRGGSVTIGTIDGFSRTAAADREARVWIDGMCRVLPDSLPINHIKTLGGGLVIRHVGGIVWLSAGAIKHRLAGVRSWFLAVLGAGLAVVAVIPKLGHRRSSELTTRCTCCGYLLTGNVTGRCPECGTTR